jgi:hypothetical protein
VPPVKKLLPVSAGAGYPAIRLDWPPLEAALGRRIPPAVKRRITVVTRNDLANAELERNTAPVSAAIRRTREISSTLAAFYVAYVKPIPDDERRTSDLFLGPRELRALALGSRDMVRRADVALRQLADAMNDDQRAGEAWAWWICHLTTTLKKAGLPTGARKDDLDQTSPFVAFVAELQKCLPERFGQHTHSKPALAKGIIKARARISKLAKERRFRDQ